MKRSAVYPTVCSVQRAVPCTVQCSAVQKHNLQIVQGPAGWQPGRLGLQACCTATVWSLGLSSGSAGRARTSF